MAPELKATIGRAPSIEKIEQPRTPVLPRSGDPQVRPRSTRCPPGPKWDSRRQNDRGVRVNMAEVSTSITFTQRLFVGIRIEKRFESPGRPACSNRRFSGGFSSWPDPAGAISGGADSIPAQKHRIFQSEDAHLCCRANCASRLECQRLTFANLGAEAKTEGHDRSPTMPSRMFFRVPVSCCDSGISSDDQGPGCRQSSSDGPRLGRSCQTAGLERHLEPLFACTKSGDH